MIARLTDLGVRRLGLLALVAVLAAAVAALALGTSSSGAADGTSASYRVNAIFDTAKGIIPGQVVKIAGARVGTVDDVTLTSDYKARIEMSVDTRFAPFKSDAACDIQPEGLISERFVQCDPGSPDGQELKQVDGVPEVPVERNHVPIAFTDLFNVFTLPVRQRFSVVVSSLGLGLAGRGDDLNAVLRRANPTLKLLRDVLERLDRDKRDLQDAVSATDAVVAALAKKPERVGDFIDRAAALTTRTANHRTALQRGIHNLPTLLDETEPTIKRFEKFTRESTPLLRQLRVAAPSIASLLGRIPAASAAGRPALRSLGATAVTGRRTIKVARPVVKLLRTFAAAAGPTGTQLADLVTNLRDRGVTESVARFSYNAVGFTGRYDSAGHIAPAHAFINLCAVFAETPDPACKATYNTTTPATSRETTRTPQRKTSGNDAPSSSGGTAPGIKLPTPAKPKLPTIQLPGLPPIQVPTLPSLGLPGLPGLRGTDRSTDPGVDPTGALLDYLLR